MVSLCVACVSGVGFKTCLCCVIGQFVSASNKKRRSIVCWFFFVAFNAVPAVAIILQNVQCTRKQTRLLSMVYFKRVIIEWLTNDAFGFHRNEIE